LADEVTRKGSALKAIIVNAESINNVDSSALHMLDEVIDQVRAAGLEIYFSGVKGPVRDALLRSGLMPRIGEGSMFMDIQEAVDWYDRKVQEHKRQVTRRYVLQTNG
ncbi:MAG: sodium-independent anion transporter, partial [Saprospiraceae bacterium]|nr:sodium-independent anion transporter [Saprospiraceae bacterium]